MRPGRAVDDGLGLHVDDIAHQAHVHALAIDRGQALTGAQQPPVLPADAHRRGAVDVEQGDQLALHGAGEDHADDVHHLGGGHPQAAAELRADAQPLEHGVDLGAAAVDDDGPHADLVEEEDVLGEGPLETIVHHALPPYLMTMVAPL